MSVKTYSYAKDQNLKLTPHFRVGEFRSFNDAAGKLTSDKILIDEALAPKLEELYARMNCSKIIVTSGYRSEDFEIALSGKTTGQHVKGKAADVICYGQDGKKIDPKRVCCAAQDVGVKGIGYMNGGVHIDVRSTKSWFDETRGNRLVSDWYGYFGIERPQPEPAKSGVTMLKAGTWNVRKGPSLDAAVARVVKGPQSVTYVDIIPESNPGKNGVRDFYLLRDGCYISVKACI